MKKYFIPFIIIFMLSSHISKAQDSIILRNGEVIIGSIVKIKVISKTEKSIKYKNFPDISGERNILSSNNIAGIKYQNGQIDIFDLKSLNQYYKDLSSKLSTTNNSQAKLAEKPQINKDSIYNAKIEKLQEELLQQKEEKEKAKKKDEENHRMLDSLTKDSIVKAQVALQKQIELQEINKKLAVNSRIQDSLNKTSNDLSKIELQKQKEINDNKHEENQRILDSLNTVSISKLQIELQKQKDEYNKKLAENLKKQDSLNNDLYKKNQEINKVQNANYNQSQKNENKAQQILDSLASFKNKLIAQNRDIKSEELRKPQFIGIGLNFLSIPSNLVDLKGNSILLPITIWKHLRIEPEFYEKDHGFNFLAFGLYAMYQKGKTNIYMGPKITFNYLDKHLSKENDTTKSRFWYPINIGAEYQFAEHFSIGGEVFYYDSWLATMHKDGTITKSQWENFTGSRIILRFYF